MQRNPDVPDSATPSNETNETIVAISTPPGRGGIGIVRLSGGEALRIGATLLRTRTPLAHAQARFAEVLDPADVLEDRSDARGGRLDEAIATYFAAPNSYTGEDIVEIAAHGSPIVLETLVRQSLKGGARLAAPGEFTQRAFLSGRIDLMQAEAVRDLIEAQTIYQARVAAQQLGGALSHRVQPLKQQLMELIAILEAGVDFAEDDIEVIAASDIVARIDALHAPLQRMAASFAHGRLVHAGFTIAIVGRPNTGKSSLFNRLIDRDRAIVTSQPGTTRDPVTERVSLGGIPVELVDTAGLRNAADEAEAIGIRKSREASADADMVLVVLDATEALNEEEKLLLASLEGRKALVAINKIDLARAGAAAQVEPSLLLPTVSTSALSGEGVAELQKQILAVVGAVAAAGAEPGMLTNLRQHQATTAAIAALAAAHSAVAAGTPHEMLLIDLYSALRELDALTGQTTTDDILNLIFSTFCIGK